MARTLPVPPTFTTGQTLTSAELNQFTTWMSFWANRPSFRVIQGVTQNIANTTTVAVTMDTVVHDSDSAWSVAGNQFVVPFAGDWQFSYGISYAGNATGGRTLNLTQNGSNVSSACPTVPGMTAFASMLVCTVTIPCQVTDTIQVVAFHNAGGTLSTSVGSQGSFLEGTLVSLATP